MIRPGPLITITVTLAGEADPTPFEAALKSLAAADPELEVNHTPARQRVIIGGISERHLELAIHKLQQEHRLQLEIGAPQTAYLETISRTIEHDYTHKRLSGGTGQYARVKIRFEPQTIGSGYQFESADVGGSVPANFVPAVAKGLEFARRKGPIAGFSVTDFRATLLDGAFHEIDSNATAFELASRACFIEAILRAGPVMLEPIMRVEVVTPQDFFGSVTGDLASRRGSITGGEMRDNAQVIQAFVPLANLFGYENDFRRLTGGPGSFNMSFERYERVPASWVDPDDTHPGAAIGLRPA